MQVLLIANDTPATRFIQESLQTASREAYEVKLATTLAEALLLLEHVGTHAVVVDADGPAGAVEKLRESDSFLPIVALIPRTEQPAALEWLRHGAQDVLGKDQLTGESLARAIRYALERMLLDRELKERDDQYRMIVENAGEGIWTIDEHDRTVFVNRRMADLLGYTPAEMMGRTPAEFMDDEWRPIGEARIAAKRRGVKDNVDFKYRRKDGSPLWTIITTNPLLDERGRYRGAMAFVMDITERKKQEEMLQRLAAVIESSSDAITGTDLEGTITNWNRAAEKLFGYPAAEAIGRSIRILCPPDRQTEVDRALTAVRHGESVPPYETQRKTRDGKLITISVAPSPVRNDQGQVIGTSAIVRDMSEQKKLEAQLQQAQKMEAVGRLAGGVAHDFNNLLTVICGYTSMLLSTAPKELHPELEEIYKAGDRAAALTRQLLAFSRKQVLQPKVLELNPLIANLEKMLQRLIGEDIELITTLPQDLGKIKADAGQIEQVIMNLVVNARDAMPNGGRLIIETRNVDIERGSIGANVDVAPGSYIQLSVSDTGIGMDKEVQSHLFEPFFTTKGLGKGTGLGLSTIYGIVRQSGGHISVYSEPGKGSTFRVYLPSTTAKATTSPVRVPIGSLEGTETILVVEDNEVVRKLTANVLAQKGYRVLTASNGEAALDACTSDGFPDLVLTDMVLPGMDGLTLCRQAARRKCGIKRMLMTGYTEEAVLRQGVAESGVPLLHKPFSPSELLTAVRGILGGAGRAPVASTS